MIRFFFPLCLILFSLSIPFISNASGQALNPNDLKHADSALYFATKGKWRDAHYHAHTVKDPATDILVSWLEYRSKDSGASFETITAFIQEHPEWPDMPLLKQRAEEAITLSTPARTITAWFSTHSPTTSDGLKALALAKKTLVAQGDKHVSLKEVHGLLRQAWVQGNFGSKEEKEFLERYATILTAEDHFNRIDQLLWQNKLDQAERILNLVNKTSQQLFHTRIALIKDKRFAETLLASLPASSLTNPGLLYDRILWNARRGNNDKAAALLRLTPASPPYLHKWWVLKNNQIRLLLKERNYQAAYTLTLGHGHEKGEDFAEAEWLSGWISLRFLHKPDQAYQHFYTLYHGVEYPVSRSRGAYWAGRAAEKNGNKTIATDWYKIAAQHQENYYGQLALLKLYKGTGCILSLPELPAITAKDRYAYGQSTLIKAAYIAEYLSKDDLAKRLLKSAVAAAKTPGQIRLITEFGMRSDQKHIMVETAKYAAKTGTVLTPMCYPIFATLPNSPLEPALALAIIRQESSFDRNAESPTGALGLMQLMPATAAEIAKELRLRYAAQLLTADHHYNIRLGSYYLAKLVNNFNGSYILAIAAYNGGQGNVRKWLKDYGDPRNVSSTEDVIDWIELIPFSETRNYVQRVLENMQVYRQLLHKTTNTSTVMLEKDLLQTRK